jgi:hypothetical protein
VYLTLAEDCLRTDSNVLRFLSTAYGLAPKLAEEAIAHVAEDETFPDEARVDAVQIAAKTLPQARQIALYCTIARTATSDVMAFDIGAKVMRTNPRAGQLLMADMATRRMPFELRLRAAELASKHGEPALKTLSDRRRPSVERLAAALVLRKINHTAGDRVLDELATAHKIGPVRIEAALQQPKRNILPSLAAIVAHRSEDETVRLAACDTILRHAPDEGREVLAGLAESAQLTRRVQERIAWLLNG